MKIRVMLCFGALMMGGCELNGAARQPVVDLAPLRCPPLAAADLAKLREAPALPPAGVVTKSGAQEWVDGLGAQVRQKGDAGQRIAATYESCRVSAEKRAS